jgi:hypothetical protein
LLCHDWTIFSLEADKSGTGKMSIEPWHRDRVMVTTQAALLKLLGKHPAEQAMIKVACVL